MQPPLRRLEIAHVEIGQRQHDGGRRHLERVVAERARADRQRPLDERTRLLRPAQQSQDGSELVQRGGDARGVGPERGLLDPQRTLADFDDAGSRGVTGAPARFEQEVDGVGERQGSSARLSLERRDQLLRRLLRLGVSSGIEQRLDRRGVGALACATPASARDGRAGKAVHVSASTDRDRRKRTAAGAPPDVPGPTTVSW